MQLVAYGAQDIYLTGNPQITFFKVVYRRHTNFSMEAIQQTINGSSTVSSTSQTSGTVTVSRNGDLVSNVYVRCDQDTTDGISGDQLIVDAELEIGGQRIDKHTKEWLQIMAELTTPESKAAGYKYLTGGFSNTLVTGSGTSQQSIMVPLQFWFCRNPGLALPLIALQYHEVKVKLTFESGAVDSGLTRKNNAAVTPSVEVWVDYIYLDTDERRRFAQQSHEYLIEQLQYQTEGSPSQKYKLNFNHPVKELIWTNTSSNLTTQRAKITLNGHDRFAEQDREYFQVRQPLDHHTAVPGYNIKEMERPLLLGGNKDIISGAAATHNAFICEAGGTLAAGQWEKVSATSIQWSTTDANHAIVGDIKVGDILLVRCADDSAIATVATGDWAAATNASLIEVLTVTTDIDGDGTAANTATLITFSSDTAFSKFLAFTPEDGTDPLQISLVARAQDPQSRCSQLNRDVNVYSFALKPEEHQPSGTCNFSRIDTAHLNFSASATVEVVYAVNYNVLRIMSGMGGLAYSN